MNMEMLDAMLPGITVDEVYCSGTRWNNVVEYSFLFQSTKKLCITITHFDLDVYRVAGRAFIDRIFYMKYVKKLNTAGNYVKNFISICEEPETFENMRLVEYVETIE